MVRSEWSCVFPLCISCPIPFSDGDPSILARRDTGVLVRLFKPRNDPRRFGPMASMCFVVVGKCTVKWVLERRKFYRDIIAPMGRIWIVKAAIVSCPLRVPGARSIRYRLFPPGRSPIQKTVVTIFVFHGYRRLGCERADSCLPGNACESEREEAIAGAVCDDELGVSLAALISAVKEASIPSKIAKEKKRSERSLSITFPIGSDSELASGTAKITSRLARGLAC